MNPLNGHKKIVAIAAGLAAICSVLSFVGGTYAGWTQRVEASVVTQRMVNAHDETLKAIVPKVETCHDVNEHQQWDIDQTKRDLSSLAESVKKTNELVQTYLQSQMRRGEIPR